MRRNRIRLVPALAATCLVALGTLIGAQAPQTPAELYNTVKQKLKDGKQVVGVTVMIPDPDIGALGIMIPMVDTVEKAENAVKFAKYPPVGRRSQGSGQYGALYGNTYRRTANDNIMIIAMIENPAGVEIADKLAAVPGIDGLFVASTDLGSFSGLRQGDAKYEALVDRVVAAAQKHGVILGGPSAWKETRKGYTFFQGPDEASLLRSGARAALGSQPPPGQPRGVAPIEGQP